MTYADTSALVRLLIAEAETPALVEYVAGAQDRTTSSELTIAELTRTVTRDAAAERGSPSSRRVARTVGNLPPVSA